MTAPAHSASPNPAPASGIEVQLVISHGPHATTRNTRIIEGEDAVRNALMVILKKENGNDPEISALIERAKREQSRQEVTPSVQLFANSAPVSPQGPSTHAHHRLVATQQDWIRVALQELTQSRNYAKRVFGFAD